MTTKIAIADDHEIFREGLSRLICENASFSLLGAAENGKELLSLVNYRKPDVVLMDLRMPVMDGLEATKYLSKKYPSVKVIALTVYDDLDSIEDMIDAGAKGYLLKNARYSVVFEAIDFVMKGKNYFCPETASRYFEKNNSKEEKNTTLRFSERELEIIRLIAKEFTGTEIAIKLCLSSRTVESYRQALLEKMQVKNVAGLVMYAVKHKLIID